MANEFVIQKGLFAADNIKMLFGDGADGEIYSDGSSLILQHPTNDTRIKCNASTVQIQPMGVSDAYNFDATNFNTFDKNIEIYREDAADPILNFSEGDGGYDYTIGIDADTEAFSICYGGALGATQTLESDTGELRLYVYGAQAASLPAATDTNIAIGVGANYGSFSTSTTIFGQGAGAAVTGFGNTCIGNNAGNTISSGTNNTCVGYGCGDAISTASNLTCLGSLAGGSATGRDSVFVGYKAGSLVSTGINNVVVGSSAALKSDATGSVVIGANAGSSNAGGGQVIIGLSAGASQTTGAASNVLIGEAAGNSLTTIVGDVHIGYEAGDALSVWYGNVIIGYQAATAATGATPYGAMTIVGYQAGYSITTGIGNTCFGNFAGYGEQAGSYNTYIGLSSGQGATGVTYNVGVGYGTLSTATGGSNVGIGKSAGNKITSGASNVAIGSNAMAGSVNHTGEDNVAIGTYALDGATSADYNIAIGYQAANATTGDYNIVLGYQAGGGTTGSHNIAIGYQSMYASATSATGYNVAIGYKAGTGITSGTNNILLGYQAGDALTTQSGNVFIGYNSGTSAAHVSTIYNTAIGYEALELVNASGAGTGDYNTAIGYKAGDTVTTGRDNVYIGAGSDGDATGYNNICIGYYANITGNNSIRIGNNSHTVFSCQGINQAAIGGTSQTVLVDTSTDQVGYTSSSIRYKENVLDLGDEKSSRIFDLRPVSFNWKKTGIADMGLIAEETAEIMPDITTFIPESKIDPDASDDMIPISVNYMGLVVPLLAEVQKLRIEVNALKEAQE